MRELVVSLVAVLFVAAIVWRVSVGPGHHAKHAGGSIPSRKPARVTTRPLPRQLEPVILVAREADVQPSRTLSLARIVLAIVIVAAVLVLVVWILGFFVNLQLARYFGR